MIESGRNINTNKWIFILMGFAFFWLVIGDLIILHQKAIYGFDPFNIEQPFAKTDNPTQKSKSDKGSKFDKFKDQYHFDILLNKNLTLITLPGEPEFEFVNTFTAFLSQSGYPLIALRAPPPITLN